MYSSLVFGIFAELCKHHHNLILGHSIIPQRNLCPLAVILHSLPPSLCLLPVYQKSREGTNSFHPAPQLHHCQVPSCFSLFLPMWLLQNVKPMSLHGPAAQGSLGDWLQMQNFRPHPRPTELESCNESPRESACKEHLNSWG